MTHYKPLPIDEIKPQFTEALVSHSQIIIHAPPGAGKSTRVPLWLLSWLENESSLQKVYLIQPRRLAASNVARRLAEESDETLGNRIGLRTRYDTVVSDKVRVEVITEGVFIRLIQANPSLDGIAGVIFDEFHERSVLLDFGLAFCLDCQRAYRDKDTPLKLLIMSATLAVKPLQDVLDNPCLLSCEGREHPVQTSYRPLNNRGQRRGLGPLESHIVSIIEEFILEDVGSVLVFLPGMKEIKRVQRLLEGKSCCAGVIIAPLHASLPVKQQALALNGSGSSRKVILSTNVAQTSLTIDGISAVIDSGLAKVSRFDAHRGLSQLEIEMISQASADQRKGRAGRLAAGKCYRLWSKEKHFRLIQFDMPEIVSGDIVAVMLEMLLWGETKIQNLTLLDVPSQRTVDAAGDLLFQLGATDPKGQITPRGKHMASLGIHPRLAAMCLDGKEQLQASLSSLLAIVLSEGNSLNTTRDCDLHLRMDTLLTSLNDKNHHSGSFNRLGKLCRTLYRRLNVSSPFLISSTEGLDLLLLNAFGDRIAKQRPDQANRYLMANGQELLLHEQDSLFNRPWLIVLDFGSTKPIPYIQLAAAIGESHIQAYLESNCHSDVNTFWDEGKGMLVSTTQQMLGKITVNRTAVAIDPDQAVSIVLRHVEESNLQSLNLNGFTQWQSRILWLQKNSSLVLPNVSTEHLLSTIEEWLPPYLIGVKSAVQLNNLSMLSILQNQLNWELQQSLNEMAPVDIALPTGATRKIDYHRMEEPVIAVKIQELYGLSETPVINNGRTPLLLELLSPASRPVQLTDDLQSFWSNTYPELCKEMKGRYPKHYWPRNPELAVATSKTKKNM